MGIYIPMKIPYDGHPLGPQFFCFCVSHECGSFLLGSHRPAQSWQDGCEARPLGTPKTDGLASQNLGDDKHMGLSENVGYIPNEIAI